MTKKDTFKRALARAEHLCSSREYCEMDIKDKLKNYPLSGEELDDILKQLRTDKFIDHSRFAKAFVNDKYRFNAWGKQKIRAHLLAKKIAEKDIDQAFSQIAEEEYENLVWQELEKKWKKLDDPDPYKKKSKLFRFAQSRGYEFEIAQRFLEQLDSTF